VRNRCFGKTPTSAATPLKSKFLSLFKKQIPIINELLAEQKVM
jgi:hypothetical protein